MIIKVGHLVEVRTWAGVSVVGVVDSVEEDIKRGIPGITYHLRGEDAPPETFWAYMDQVKQII